MKRKWRWVSRDSGSGSILVRVWPGEESPKFFSDFGQWDSDTEGFAVGYQDFRVLFGIDVKPGQCIKVEFDGRVVNE